MKLHELLEIITYATDGEGRLDIEIVLEKILASLSYDLEVVASFNRNLEFELKDIKQSRYDDGYSDAEAEYKKE